MIRTIHCEKCGVLKPMHPEDVAMGFLRRRLIFKGVKPADHAITVNGEKQPQMSSLACDLCGQDIPDGSTVVATTMWQKDREGTPGIWETEYGYRP